MLNRKLSGIWGAHWIADLQLYNHIYREFQPFHCRWQLKKSQRNNKIMITQDNTKSDQEDYRTQTLCKCLWFTPAGLSSCHFFFKGADFKKQFASNRLTCQALLWSCQTNLIGKRQVSSPPLFQVYYVAASCSHKYLSSTDKTTSGTEGDQRKTDKLTLLWFLSRCQIAHFGPPLSAASPLFPVSWKMYCTKRDFRWAFQPHSLSDGNPDGS